jgi:hypothetical protein
MMTDISQYLRPRRRRRRRISWKKKKAVLGPPLGWRHAVYRRKKPWAQHTLPGKKKGHSKSFLGSPASSTPVGPHLLLLLFSYLQ